MSLFHYIHRSVGMFHFLKMAVNLKVICCVSWLVALTTTAKGKENILVLSLGSKQARISLQFGKYAQKYCKLRRRLSTSIMQVSNQV